jgi:myo-inositol 2-dehydrogenase/D-chiro-inositol 1-dehydrogenase
MPVTETAIHEIDVVRWLLDDEIVAARVLQPRKSSRAHANMPTYDEVMAFVDQHGGF